MKRKPKAYQQGYNCGLELGREFANNEKQALVARIKQLERAAESIKEREQAVRLKALEAIAQITEAAANTLRSFDHNL